MSKENYLPFGFRYPPGAEHTEANPDPKIEAIRERMEFLNEIHETSGLRGEVFTAAMAAFQAESNALVSDFWEKIKKVLTVPELAQIANALADRYRDEPTRLAFPNAVALFDCRFVSNEEWEYVRRYSIGGSEATAILGLSHFQSPRGIYYEKTAQPNKRRGIAQQHILDYGHAVEPYIIEQTAAILGAKIWPEYRMFAHKDYPFITCNPDAILCFPDGRYTLFEAKTAFWKKRADWQEGVPGYYQPQPAHYLEVLDSPLLNDGFISVCFGPLATDFKGHFYKRNRTEGTKLIQTEVDFWNSYIAACVLPPLTGNPELDMQACYGYTGHQECSTDAVLDADCEATFARYFTLRQDKKEPDARVRKLKEEENSLLEQIRTMVPDGYTTTTLPGRMTYRIKVADKQRESVSMKQLSERNPVAATVLSGIAANLKDYGTGWSLPKVK